MGMNDQRDGATQVPTGDHISMTAEAGAHVGQQIGVNRGTIHQTLSSTPHHAAPDSHQEIAELRAQLAELREALEAARTERLIDARTFQDATQELDQATEDAGSPDPEGRSRLLRSLEKLRTAVRHVSGIAVSVSQIISAVGGRP